MHWVINALGDGKNNPCILMKQDPATIQAAPNLFIGAAHKDAVDAPEAACHQGTPRENCMALVNLENHYMSPCIEWISDLDLTIRVFVPGLMHESTRGPAWSEALLQCTAQTYILKTTEAEVQIGVPGQQECPWFGHALHGTL